MRPKHDHDRINTSRAPAEDPSGRELTRRGALTVIGAAGAMSLAVVGSRAWAQVCSLTPSQTQGPFWVDEMLNRSDIRIDPSDNSVEPGVPLQLDFNVLRADAGCAPATGVRVDVWHCNAPGRYSDIASEGTAGEMWLRGYQTTDANGAVQFTTIYPGWYVSRTIHIHFRIRTFNGATTTYNFTSQVYFDDTISNQVIANNAEYDHGTRGTNNSNDMLYFAGNELALVEDGNGGYVGTFDVALNGLPTSGTTPTPTPTTATTPSPTPTPGVCTVMSVPDPKARVSLNARRDAGRVSANMVIDLASYTNELVTVSLSDSDTPTIAAQSVGTLLAVGSSGKKWQFKTKADGIQQVILKSLAPRQPGRFKLSVASKHWFTAAAANQTAANTFLNVQIGPTCYTHAVTRKLG